MGEGGFSRRQGEAAWPEHAAAAPADPGPSRCAVRSDEHDSQARSENETSVNFLNR
jgi:hypothetical protein